MSSVKPVVMIGVGRVIIRDNGQVVPLSRYQYNQKTRYERDTEDLIKRRREQYIASMEKNKKMGFITQFIDEIPELSYYEAAQLKKKIGCIYLEWNDE